MLWFEAKSTQVRGSNGKAPYGLADRREPHGRMATKPDLDPDRIALIVQLCTRIGMIMEDVSPIALDASVDGLHARVQVISDANGTIVALTEAAAALLPDLWIGVQKGL